MYVCDEKGYQTLRAELDYLKGWSPHTENRDTDKILAEILKPTLSCS